MTDARVDLLVRDCWPRLVRRAYLLTGAQQAAEELVRNALTRRLDEARTEDELRDALVSEAFRHAALYKSGSAPFAEQGAATEPMRTALRRLTLDERVVLVLRHQDGWDAKQVEDRLHVSDNGLHKREKRALRALREAGVVPQDEQARPGELRALLDAVADQVSPSQPPDVQALRAAGSRREWGRLVLLGALAAAVAAVAAAAWPF